MHPHPRQPAPEPGENDVVLSDVVVELGGRNVLDGLSCAFPRGRITVILGGSGNGKTTLLRVIGGLIRVRAGSVRVLGREVTDLSERQLYAVRDHLGMMFQNGALLDSLTVLDNLALPLREHARLREDEVARQVGACLASVGLAGIEGLFLREFSGGMVKRVALARAILMRPRVLLCDEPFSGLDPVSARRVEELLVRINREQGITLAVVSHDVASTMRMADQVVLLLPTGVHRGTPDELRTSPDPHVAAFLNPDASEVVAGAPLPEVERR